MTINRGKSDEEIAKRYLQRVADRKKTANPEMQISSKQEEKSKIILPATNIQNPEDYIILEGKTYDNYSYSDLLVAKQKTLFNKTQDECHKELNKQGNFMLAIRQFADFLTLLKSGKAFDGAGNKIDSKELEQILNEIVEVRSPWRAERLDADFKVYNGVLHINYEHRVNSNGKLKPNYSEKLEDCLMQDKTPGINFDDWLKNANKQGLPKSDVKKGKLYYWYPRDDNNSVAGFDADSDWAGLDCSGYPGDRDDSLGVRASVEKI